MTALSYARYILARFSRSARFPLLPAALIALALAAGLSALPSQVQSDAPEACINTNERTRPKPPRNVTVTPGDGRLLVTWDAPAQGAAPCVYYVWWMQQNGDGSWPRYTTRNKGYTAPGERRFVIAGLANGRSVQVNVESVIPQSWDAFGPVAPRGTTYRSHPDPREYATPRAPAVKSSDATLDKIYLLRQDGIIAELSPSFNAAATEYTAETPQNVAWVTVWPLVNELNARYEIEHTQRNVLGRSWRQVDLAKGVPKAIRIWVTAHDGTKKTYRVTVTRRDPADPGLRGLTISDGTNPVLLTPDFAPAATAYTASVGSAVASVMVTPTVNISGATVTVDGSAVTSGSASSPIALTAGQAKVIDIVVTAPNGRATRTYRATVTRRQPSDATLSALTLSDGTNNVPLAPAFNSATTGYAATVASAVAGVTVTPTVSQSGATVTVDGSAVTSGSASSAIALTAGQAKDIAVVVTAPDSSTNTYTVRVTRPGSSDATLSALAVSGITEASQFASFDLTAADGTSPATLAPAFDPAVTEYAVSVPYTVTQMTVTPTVSQSGATVAVDSSAVTSGSASRVYYFSHGTFRHEIAVAVTAQDGTVQTYTVVATRQMSRHGYPCLPKNPGAPLLYVTPGDRQLLLEWNVSLETHEAPIGAFRIEIRPPGEAWATLAVLTEDPPIAGPFADAEGKQIHHYRSYTIESLPDGSRLQNGAQYPFAVRPVDVNGETGVRYRQQVVGKVPGTTSNQKFRCVYNAGTPDPASPGKTWPQFVAVDDMDVNRGNDAAGRQSSPGLLSQPQPIEQGQPADPPPEAPQPADPTPTPTPTPEPQPVAPEPPAQSEPQQQEPARTFSVSAAASVAEGENAGLVITLSQAAPADGVEFTVTADYAGASTATAADVGSVASPVTVAEGDATLEIAIPTVGDAVDEDDETFTVAIATAADGWVKAGDGQDTAAITIQDDDTAGVTLSSATLNVVEGGSGTYTLVLDSQPARKVKIMALSLDKDAVGFSPRYLTFTPKQWNVAQPFTVYGVADDDADDEAVSIRHYAYSGDAGYEYLDLPAVVVTVTDRAPPQGDQPEPQEQPPPAEPEPEEQKQESARTFSVSAAASAAEGESAALVITLSQAAPADGVEFTVTAGYGGSSTAASGDVGSITSPVTVAEGDATLEIAIPTVGDAVDEDDETFTVTVAATTAGWEKAGDGQDTATVTITDDDTAGVTITPTTLNVAEVGSAAYTVVLDSKPAYDVYVLLENSDTGAVDVSQSAYAFTPDDWNTAHTYTVSALADDDRDDESVTISHTAYSPDGQYDEIAVASVVVAVADSTPEPEKQQEEPPPAEKPGPVVGLEVSAKGKKATVRWQAPESGDAPDRYMVNLKPADGGKGKTKRVKGGKTSVTYKNLERGATYKVWVRAENAAGKGERVRASITLPE